MIYLIESYDYYKIGYAIDIKSRMKTYATHNPDFKLLDECNGNEKIETILHRELKHLRIKGEWFQKDPEVLKVWNFYKEICSEILSSEEVMISTKESLKKIREEKSEDTKTIMFQGEQIDKLKSQVNTLLENNKELLNNSKQLINLEQKRQDVTENKIEKLNKILKGILDISVDRLSEEEIVDLENTYHIKINRNRKQTII